MAKKELQNLRNQINKLDNKILDLIDQRSHVVTKIGKLKDKSKGVIDQDREQAILSRLTSATAGKYSKNSIIRIWRELFEASSKLQIDTKASISTKRSIDSIDVYKGGGSKIKNLKNIVKLSSNENPLGPSKTILDSLNKKLNLNRYPEIDGSTLRNKISEFHNIESNQIILGCGSDETLLFAALAFCQPGDEIIHAEHGFEMYSIISKIAGATSKIIKEDENFKINIKSILNAVTPSTKIIYLANPNNPTGTYLTRREIVELLKSLPKNIILVLDGAYAEYVIKDDYDPGFSLADEFDNVVITRTFSKAYGLAGLRIGWCYSSEKVALILNKVKGPFNTQSISQEIAIIALDDKDYLKKVIDNNHNIKNWFEEELKKLYINTRSSEGNFSFIETSEEKAIKISKHLTNEGILVRQLDSYGLPNCLRITIGTKQEMETTIKALKKIS